MKKRKSDGIVIGLQHISHSENDRINLKKEKYTIGEYRILKSKNQELNHECEICREKLRIIIFSEDIVVKQFWRLILGLITTIIASIILFEYIQYGVILFVMGGLWVSLKLVSPRAKIVNSKRTSQKERGLTSNEITDQLYDPSIQREKEQENSNPIIKRDKKSEHKILYKIFSV
ncbi:MAG: hypothetical protein HeimC2_37580 [Candidatus Heimdallarchaeota archaeon LC_2]|nr:MAG: hypothetical protein HeimC2_37580 [Candidatus Heimdallarchaeota archaeon LC_2]